MACRGIRGAIDVAENREDALLQATRTLLLEIVAENQVQVEDVAAVTFSTTQDINAAYPARAARDLGWTLVPLFCVQEMNVPGSLERCLRVLVLWNTERSQAEIRHVYLGKARSLRPDLEPK